MIRHQVLPIVLSVLSLAALAESTRAANVWDEVPADALGAVVVRDLSHADDAVGKLLRALQFPLLQPLTLVKAATGIDQGLNQQGDLLVAALPGHSGDGRPQLAVWLPIGDYDQLVRSLHGVPRERITAVTIGGEDVLVARHGDWAVVVDSDGRGRLEQLLDARPSSRRAVPAAWDDWVKSNDVTAILLRPAIGQVLAAAASQPTGESADHEAEPVPPADHFLFSFDGQSAAASPWQAAQSAVGAALSDMPELSRRLRQAEAVGCGLRLDADGNAVIAARLTWPRRATPEPRSSVAPSAAAPVPYDGGPFVAAGAGEVSASLLAAAAGPYARLLAKDLGIDVREQSAAVEALRKALAAAAEDVTAFAVLSRPGQGSDGVYTNSHLVVQVRSAKDFVDRTAEVVARWNELADHADGDMHMKFKSEPVRIAGRGGTQHSADMVEAVGGRDLPEVRQSMERLFGPGGKLRLLVVPIDDRTVLLAGATDEQAAKVVDLVIQGRTAPWQQDDLQPTGRLVPADAPWRVFVSPHGYVQWLARQMDAIAGPVLGGPLVKEFPDSPPLGISGGGTSDGIWLELVAPAKTVEAVGQAMRE
jgi:hypothetical protein